MTTKNITTLLFKIALISLMVFSTNISYAGNYGGYHYYGYHNYPHNYHRRHHGHYRHGSSNVGYIILGVLGAAVLAHILTKDRVESTPPIIKNKQPVVYNKPVPKKKTYHYNDHEDWDWLAQGNMTRALDIFAVQSQQRLNSGIPKIGFALAAASHGENERAARAMRKALRVDAFALNKINTIHIKTELENLSRHYGIISDSETTNSDNAFMLATLSYLQQDYVTANKLISNNDQSQSAINLRHLLQRVN